MASPFGTAQQVRIRVQDVHKVASLVQYGDGITTRFELGGYTNIQSGTAYVQPGGTAWSATGGVTFNATGFMTFTDRISANSGVRLDFVHSTFSDDEIGHFTAVGGSVAGAALEAVRALYFDGLKRSRWMSPDGTQFSDEMAINLLRQIESALHYELGQDAIAGGGLESWGETQKDYT